MLILICGLPRAGKTTYAERYDDVIHLDTCGAYRGVIHTIRGKKGNVVVEGVYQNRHLRETLIKAYNGSGCKCIWLNTSQEIRQKRKGWHKGCDYYFEPPTLDEGWDEIIIIEDNNDESISNKR